MKYWAYLVAKLVAAGSVLWVLQRALAYIFPTPAPFLNVRLDPFAHDTGYTFAMLLYWLLALGLLWVIVWDHRYRCRTCLRRLRMPIQKGSWTHVLLGAPRTEYICPYGHGTLEVAELQITGRQEPDWQEHEDMWKELMAIEESEK